MLSYAQVSAVGRSRLACLACAFACMATQAGAAEAAKLSSPQQLARDIYQELVEINTAQSVGDTYRAAAFRASVVPSFLVGLLVFMDKTVSSFAAYSDAVNGRPIATVGSKTPNFEGTFWEVTLDTMTRIINNFQPDSTRIRSQGGVGAG